MSHYKQEPIRELKKRAESITPGNFFKRAESVRIQNIDLTQKEVKKRRG